MRAFTTFFIIFLIVPVLNSYPRDLYTAFITPNNEDAPIKIILTNQHSSACVGNQYNVRMDNEEGLFCWSYTSDYSVAVGIEGYIPTEKVIYKSTDGFKNTLDRTWLMFSEFIDRLLR